MTIGKRTQAVCFVVLVLFAVSRIANSDQPQRTPSVVKPKLSADLEKEGALQEIQRIRSSLGGSVLKGSLLETPDAEDASFESGVRHQLGLPKQTQSLKSSQGTSGVVTQTNTQIVKTLRRHSTELDRIANEIEPLQQYKNADSLRETAKQMRLMARQFDLPKQPTTRHHDSP